MLKQTTALMALLLGTCTIGLKADDTVKIDFDQMKLDTSSIVRSTTLSDSSVPAPKIADTDTVDKAKASPKKWTIMVFMNAKNNLEPFGLKDMNEMEAVGSSNDVNVVVELARIKGYSNADGDWTGARRYLVQKDSNPNKISSPVVQTLASADMGDYKHLIEFGQWAKKNYPAQNYMLVVWNHGAGWEKSLASRVTKGISYDDETNHHITTPQLGMALAQIGKINLLGTDACLMQMAEVDYEVKNYVDYIIGSEETEPGDGYTYDAFLKKLVANPSATPQDLGGYVVDAYADHYMNTSEGSTQALVKASEIPALTTLINDWATMMMSGNEKAMIAAAASSSQSFAMADNKDLADFAKNVAAKTKDQKLAAKCNEVISFVTGRLVLKNRTTNGYDASKGLAIYIPTQYDSNYNELAWAKDSKWDEFVQWLIKK